MLTMQWHIHFYALHSATELNILYAVVTNESPSETIEMLKTYADMLFKFSRQEKNSSNM